MKPIRRLMSKFPCVLVKNTLKINNDIFILPFARQDSAFTRRLRDIGHHDFARQNQEFKKRRKVGEKLTF
jgi:hypothetical protein